MPPIEPSTKDAPEIEVGAAAGELRLWKAREAVRHAELSLKSQTEARENLRGAATSLLGWAVTAIGVVAAATLSAPHPAWQGAAAVAVAMLLVAAALCVASLFPRRWARPGYDPDQVLGSPLSSELEILESIARGGSLDMRANRANLIFTSTFLRAGWIFFACTPVVGLATLALWGRGVGRVLAPLLGVVWNPNG